MTVWVTYNIDYGNFCDVAVFETELEALRYAIAQHCERVIELPFGKSLHDVVFAG